MRKILAGAVLIVIVALWIHRDFITAPPTDVNTINDHAFFLPAYNAIEDPRDLAAQFTGPWLNTVGAAYRPLSGIIVAAEMWFGFNVSWSLVSWITFLLFCSVCLLTATLAYRLTKSHPLALLSGLLLTNIGYWCPSLPAQGGDGVPLMRWYAIADSLLAINATLAASVAFLLWCERSERRYLITAWCFTIAAMLSKEIGLVVPGMILALCCLVPKERRETSLKHGVLMGCLSVAVFAVRWFVVPPTYDTPVSRSQAAMDAVKAWLYVPSPYDIFIMNLPEQLMWIAIYGLAAGALIAASRNKSQALCYAQNTLQAGVTSRLIATGVVTQIAYLPVLGFDFKMHYGLGGAAMRCVFAAVAVRAILTLIQAIQRDATTRREAARAGIKPDATNRLGQAPHPANVIVVNDHAGNVQQRVA